MAGSAAPCPAGEAFSIDEATTILRRTPAVLDLLLSGLPARLLHAREEGEAWSPLQVVAHLAWGEIDDWIPRLERLLGAGSSVAFAPFDREGGFARYEGWTCEQLLEEFAARRRASLAALERHALTSADLRREGRHPEFGIVTLEQLLATWATHDLAHLAQITRTLTRAEGRFAGPWRTYFSLLRA